MRENFHISQWLQVYNASKREYYYGLKIQVIVNEDALPVEVFMMPGSHHDAKAYDLLPFELPKKAKLLADNAYDSEEMRQMLNDQDIELLCQKRKNSKKPLPWHQGQQITKYQKSIETVFSVITSFSPKKIHAGTAHGSTIKILLFIMAYSLDKYLHN